MAEKFSVADLLHFFFVLYGSSLLYYFSAILSAILTPYRSHVSSAQCLQHR